MPQSAMTSFTLYVTHIASLRARHSLVIDVKK